MHAHSDADMYMQIAHMRLVRKFLDAYLCIAMYTKYSLKEETRPEIMVTEDCK